MMGFHRSPNAIRVLMGMALAFVSLPVGAASEDVAVPALPAASAVTEFSIPAEPARPGAHPSITLSDAFEVAEFNAVSSGNNIKVTAEIQELGSRRIEAREIDDGLQAFFVMVKRRDGGIKEFVSWLTHPPGRVIEIAEDLSVEDGESLMYGLRSVKGVVEIEGVGGCFSWCASCEESAIVNCSNNGGTIESFDCGWGQDPYCRCECTDD